MNNLFKISLSILLLFAFASLTSCSDNGSDGSGPSDPANGIWIGTFAETDGGTYEITAYLYDDRIIIFGRGFDGFDGNYLINGKDISADGNLYTYVHDIPPRYPATLSGTILARDSISATLSDSEGKTGSVSLNYDAILYNRSSSLSLLVGSWSISGINATIDENGEVSGQVTPGCSVKGSINILDTSYNLYDMDFIIDCGHSQPGRVTGLSALLDSDTLQVAASNDLYFYDSNWVRLHEATELEGAWIRTIPSLFSQTERYVFSGNDYDYLNRFEDTRDCAICEEIPATECTEYGTFEIGDSFMTSSGVVAYPVDFLKENGDCSELHSVEETLNYAMIDDALYLWPIDTKPGREFRRPYNRSVDPSPPIPYSIGDTGPAGGIVFYVTDGGLHGLEAAPENQGITSWGCEGIDISGADGASVGTGRQNTADILAGCSESGIAAELADNYSLNGYTDWFLPSKDELNELYTRRHIVGGLIPKDIWNSTEYDNVKAWYQEFDDSAFQLPDEKSRNHVTVRAIRAF